MSEKEAGSASGKLRQASRVACEALGIPQVGLPRLDDALFGAIDPQRLINNLAEAWRTTPEQAREFLESNGFATAIARLRTQAASGTDRAEEKGPPLTDRATYRICDGRISIRTIKPGLSDAVSAPKQVLDTVDKALAAFLPGAADDALGILYRREPAVYCERFLASEAPRIDAYVREHFSPTGPRYIVNSGIGANEQFNYFVSALANARPGKHPIWLPANSPKEVAALPVDATVENTLFMEFSRSGITEETIKLHEFTPAAARRIVFANSGSLRDLAIRDKNLLLELPGEVSGRYGRNKTPILMAPMHVCGLDVRSYWRTIETACRDMPLDRADGLPVVLARFLRIQQLRHGVNHIYFGVNDGLLQTSADELCQFWNEGVNRDGNDMTLSRYLGLPRDSHMNLEAMLGTAEHKMAIFLLRTGGGDVATDAAAMPHSGGPEVRTPPDASANALGRRSTLLQSTINPINPAHAGLTPRKTDLILALANVQRCSEKMPTVLITVDAPDLSVSAWLGQLWADTTLVYSRLIGVDPGSNPEVKAVRTRAAAWLADPAAAMRLIK